MHKHIALACLQITCTASCTRTTATFPVFLANLLTAPCEPALNKCYVKVPVLAVLAVTVFDDLTLPTVRRSVAILFSPWKIIICAHSCCSLTLDSASLWADLVLTGGTHCSLLALRAVSSAFTGSE